MKRFALVAGLAVAACSPQSGNETGGNASMTPVPAISGTPQPAATATPAEAPSPAASSAAPAPTGNAVAGKLPPAGGATPRYVGRWAATRQLCDSGAWRFYATHLETAGEVSCSYHRVDTVPGGYDLHATCIAQAPPVADVIKLRFAESAQAMLVESKTLKATGLIYCGALKGD